MLNYAEPTGSSAIVPFLTPVPCSQPQAHTTEPLPAMAQPQASPDWTTDGDFGCLRYKGKKGAIRIPVVVWMGCDAAFAQGVGPNAFCRAVGVSDSVPRGKRQMKQQRQHSGGQGQLQTLTKAVTHIRLIQVNPGKLAALYTLALIYLALCQQYVTLFCSDEHPDKFNLCPDF